MLYKKNRKRTYILALLLSITFLLEFALTPNAYTRISNHTNQKHYRPFTQYGEVYIVNDYTGNELLGNTEINYIVGRNLKGFHRFLYRPLDIVVFPMLCFSILLIYLSSYHKKRQRGLPVMAASLGGHAPPAGLFSCV